MFGAKFMLQTFSNVLFDMCGYAYGIDIGMVDFLLMMVFVHTCGRTHLSGTGT